MSPDSSLGRYEAPTAESMMNSAHKEREPELHIGRMRQVPTALVCLLLTTFKINTVMLKVIFLTNVFPNI